MTWLLVAGWLLSATVVAPDTTVELRRGDRVVVQGLSGHVEVRGWDRESVSVTGPGGGEVSLRREGTRVVVDPGVGRGRERQAALEIQVPAWAEVEVQGVSLEVRVVGTAAAVQVRTVVGDIVAQGTSGPLSLSAVDGGIEVRDARGRVTVRSREGDVTVIGAEGVVEAVTVSGDVRLERVRGSEVRGETLAGNLTFHGSLSPGGSYRFAVHSGDAVVTVPADTGARVRVSTFEGEFTSDFPVTLRRYGGRGTFDFTLGDGGASLEIQVFDGGIRLRSAAR